MPAAKRKADSVGADTDLTALSRSDVAALFAQGTAVDVKKGVLEVFGEQVMLLRPPVLVNIQKQLEQTVGASTKGMIYLAGERSGREGLYLFRSLAPPSNDDASSALYLRHLVDSAALSGWGRFEIGALDLEASRIALTLENSPIAAHYGSSKKPVCYFIAGWLAGIGKALFGLELLCEETACTAQGRPRCEFQMRPMPSL